MRWTNKGHQFDEIGKNFINKKVYIYGTGGRGADLYKRMEYLDCVEGFVDRDIEKQKSGFLGKPVISQSEFLRLDKNNVIVIVAIGNYISVMQILLSSGYTEGVNCFHDLMFIYFYLDIFALYGHNSLRLPIIVLGITQKCTLSCKHCCGYIPYIENPAHVSTDKIIKRIDNIFSTIDFGEEIHISGGEAFLHPELCDIVEYLFDKYSTRFNKISIYTNGFSNAGGDIIKMMGNSHRVSIHWTNYTDYLGEPYKSKILANVSKYRDSGINIEEFKQPYWSDVRFNKDASLNESEDSLTERFNDCLRCYSVIGDGKFHACSMGYLCEVLIGEDIEQDVVQFPSADENLKHVILEVSRGFTEKGYVEACKYCLGVGVVNPNKVVPAEQL